MKKVRILKLKLMTLIFTLLLAIMVNNISYAATYSGRSGVVSLLAADPETVLRENSTISLGFQDLISSDNIYCMEKGQDNKSDPANYRILTYIEINGWSAKVWQRNDETGGVTYQGERWTSSNAILAEILSGNYGDGKTGYGSGENQYTSAQKAFYVYFEEWQGYVGVELGIDSSWVTCNDYEDDGTGAAIVTEATNKVKTEGSEATARIYLLDNAQYNSWQRLMVAEANSPTTDEDEPENPDYDGYIRIKGKVWLDGEAGKSSQINGTYGDSSDSGLGGIKVKLLDSGGHEFKGGSHTTTDGNGNYEIVVNLDTNYKVYKLWEDPEVVRNKLLYGAYVEFEYDGHLYTTVAASSTGEKTSKATENNSLRLSKDKQYTTVTPGLGTPSYTVTASTESMFKFADYTYKTTENENPTTIWCNSDGDRTYYETETDHKDKGTWWQTNPDEWLKPILKTNMDMHCIHNSHTEWDYNRIIGYQEDGITPIYYSWNQFDNDQYCAHYAPGGHSIQTTPITNLIIYNVNLGLFKREHPDIALTSDIDRVEVDMNNQRYTYQYKSQIGTPSYDDDNHFGTVKFQNKYIYTYRRPVNPADIAYINDPSSGAEKEALKIYVTYRVKLSNQSNTLGVTVQKLVSDYDLEYTIVTDKWDAEPGNTIAKDWNTDSDETNKAKGYKKSVVSKDLNIKLNPGEIKEVEVKYKISEKAIKGLISQDSTLSNVFEIHTYSTQYGSSTLCAEQKTGSQLGRTGKAYGGIDIDSQPGNAEAKIADKVTVNGDEVLDVTNEQDDTDIAPSFIIELAKEYKTIAGTVFEDTQVNDSKVKGERYGNGAKDNKEVGVRDVRVELWDLDLNEGKGGIATIYGIKDGKPVPQKAVTWTDKDGNFSFGKNKENDFPNSFGVVVNNYCIKYVYGNNDIKENRENVATTINEYAINARNYKSTIVTKNPIKDIMQGKEVTNSNKWHLLDGVDSTTTAVDNLEIRKGIDGQSLKYSNFNTAYNMEANSKSFEMQVEYTIDPWAEVDYSGNNASLKNTCSTFDFGIIERPRENVIIDKSMTKIRITLANGQILIDGDPRTDKLDYTKVLGLKTIIDDRAKVKTARDKLVSIEMDNEYIQGATLEVWYAIRVTNQSEIDYEYSTSQPGYYYYGNDTGLDKIENHVFTVVDYVDPELVVEKDTTTVEKTGEEITRNEDWDIGTVDAANELYTDGYISEKTKTTLINNKYMVLKTYKFKDMKIPRGETSEPVELYASKLLSNKEDALSFENHTEIVEINGKVARTIDSVETKDGKRIQNTKEYKPGDYVPNETREYDENKNKEIISSIEPIEKAGLHEQDDDMVKITITPPTGLGNNIMIYIITAVIVLTITGIGIYFIKKKVL